MTSAKYIRIDLWRYIKIDRDDIRSDFKFIRFITQYIFYAITICVSTMVILANVNLRVSVILNLLNAFIVCNVIEGNMIGNTVLNVCVRRLRDVYRVESSLVVYDTRKAVREIRKMVYIIYSAVFILLGAAILYILLLAANMDIDKSLKMVFFILLYLFLIWLNRKTVIRKLSLIFGV